MLGVTGALVDPLATDPKKYRYEASKFEFIGTADSGTRVCFTSARSGVVVTMGEAEVTARARPWDSPRRAQSRGPTAATASAEVTTGWISISARSRQRAAHCSRRARSSHSMS